jgi:ribosomal-protein-serine acetyltransferase
MLIATLDDGVELRLLELRHVAEYYRLVADNFERLYWLPAPPTPESTERRLRGGLGRFAEGTGVDAGIWDHGVPVGFCGLFAIDSVCQGAEIGYWLDKGTEGRGLITRAARAMLKHAFDELKLHRVELRCAATNARSIAVDERLGFRLEGRLVKGDRIGDEWVDFLIYGLLEEEWAAQPDAEPGAKT